MAILGIFGRRWVRCLGVTGIAAAGYVAGLTTDRVTAQQPGTGQQLGMAPLPSADKRIVAYIYGTTPITREELGDFLIARGGYEKLDLLVNRRIIEIEAAKRNITVTALEIESALAEDVRGFGTVGDFAKVILPRYGKTLYEWTEDVIKPRLLLAKMCQGQVKVTDEDLKKAFENKYGERRQAKIICWNKEDLRAAERQWDEARKGDVDFDRIARSQATPSLAASCGQIAPIGRYPGVEDETCTKKLYQLQKVGEMTELFQTPAGVMCMKLVAILPPDATVTYEKVRATFEREMYDKKLAEEIPKFFNKLKAAAQPNLLLKGPPTSSDVREAAKQEVEELRQSGGNQPGTTPPRKP
jgi:hypothetical protein